jgi:bacterioferritin (cytochrome b1)
MALTISPETVATDTIIAQLRAIEQLTRAEAHTARIRIAQAGTDEVRRELRQNASDATSRIERIIAQLRALDAAPDVVTPAISRVVSMIKSTLEQAQPVEEALFIDLTMEHQLRDRARYVKVLAQRAELPAVEKLADDLVAKHAQTIDWITTTLAEEALGGPAKLVPTPLQRVAGGVAQALTLPTRFAVQGVNRAVDGLARVGDQARDTVSSVVGTVSRVGADGREVVTAGRDAVLRKTEQVAERDGAEPVAGIVHAARADMGSLKASELPIKGFEELTAQGAAAAVRDLTDPDDVTTMLAFEERNRNRAGVVSAARSRFAALAKDAAKS